MEERRVREREKGVERNKVKERKWGKMRREEEVGGRVRERSPTAGRALGKSKARGPSVGRVGGLSWGEGVTHLWSPGPPDRGTSLELFPSHLSHIPLQLESFHGVLPPSPSGISLREP
ncbi:hypothetical protein CK203_065598 [Vitis vinifera]|uniref:Uncharacterized protein n=1 Tax=Vitis vinifera TaxID=29760 RepID=A0A438G306_VITVI|nr:hypothetical protein CK203_065598 [Vitis vinifera]